MKILVDTCVVIDFLRGFPPAVAFFDEMSNCPAISTITVAELFAGAKNKAKKEAVGSIIDTFEIIEVSQEIAKKGGEWSCQYTPSHGVDLPDALIGATAKIKGFHLATCNLKHFPMFPDLERPYNR
jgi:predicted nucleic acid-binding protein